MRLLLDTHLLLWLAGLPHRLSAEALALINDPTNQLLFSAVSIWEVAIKSALKRADVRADPRRLHRRLLDAGYIELPVTSLHAVTIDSLPLLHTDPFDRLLLAQAISEGIVLVTADAQLAAYPGPVRRV